MDFKRVITQDGSITLVHPEFGEAYSSVHGALMQATELYLNTSGTAQHRAPQVLEMGFGLGVNFRVTLADCLERGVRLHYKSIEGFPVAANVLEGVLVPLAAAATEIWGQVLWRWQLGESFLLESDWGSLEVIMRDFSDVALPVGWATAVYFDPFSPDANPAPWDAGFLAEVYQCCAPGAMLVTYSVAGTVRRNLARVGFEVSKTPAVGKREWLKALK
jgi:tRNA U34 5-methylaminomethyl-2-thiouridine-forming methyltransferase MnmC